MKQWQWSFGLVFGLYFLALTVALWGMGWAIVWLWVGALLGWIFTYVDRLIHVYLTAPSDQLSLQVKYLVSQHRYKDVWQLLRQRGDEQRYLMVKSVFFMAVFLPLGLYVITSTGSFLAVGMMMAIGLQLLLAIADDWPNLNKIKAWLFWPIKRTISDKEVKWAAALFMLAFALLSLMII